MADGVRRIARALHKRASEEGKKQAKAFFEKFDFKGDGKINLEEFLKAAELNLSNEKVVKQLRSNADESLSFDDALVLFYCKTNAIAILGCGGCRELIFGPSFSCFECLFDSSSDGRFAVCCDCYGEGKFQHQHPLSPFNVFSEQALLDACNKRKTDDPKTLAKKEMEKLSKIAESHYKAASTEVKNMAKDFFKSMDIDGDEGVDLEEFLTFMRENGYTHMHNNQIFKMLDMDGNGSLGFWEVMTLYYIIKSERPFCNCCAEFIPDIYFSCVDCFKDANAKPSYNICCVCYESNKCKHHQHKGTPALFLDNYTLLQIAGADSKRKEKAQVSEDSVSQQQPKRDSAQKNSTVTEFPENEFDSPTEYMMYEFHRVLQQSQSTAIVTRTKSTPSTSETHYANPQSTSRAIIKVSSEMELAVAAFKVLEATLTITSLSATLCTIL